MEKIDCVSLEPCVDSKFVQPYRMRYKQNGQPRIWDCVKQHDSVAVLIFHKSRSEFVFVRQFRPVVYLAHNKDKIKNHPVFATPLNVKTKSASSTPQPATANDQIPVEDLSTIFTPSSTGLTHELCAGVVDSENSYEQITKEEILEECGYDVPLNCIEKITSYYSSVGVSGSYQTLFYAEVSDDMLVNKGGGSAAEGEMIDVVYISLDEITTFMYDEKKLKTPSVVLAIMWFLQKKLPSLKK
ncbi:uridine diphosphate glucose pyrophosphatase NUDT14-like [Dysidea avara]|uniref:uridine diphosphate glucose pyrophosphatase NUDT14-like n=1 Tax=Dysidea avara TaxID=196820 RepID=UPI00332B5B69